MAMADYLDQRYDDTFEAVFEGLSEMARHMPDQAVLHIRQTLKSLYVRQGNDWTGRGAIGNAGLDASVAAHEAVLAQLVASVTAKQGDEP